MMSKVLNHNSGKPESREKDQFGRTYIEVSFQDQFMEPLQLVQDKKGNTHQSMPNTFKEARDASATDPYSFFIVVSCFAGQNWKRDFVAYSTISLWYYTRLWYGRLGKVGLSFSIHFQL